MSPVEPLSPAQEAQHFRIWLEANRDELAHLRDLHADADQRVASLNELQGRLYEAGWSGLGWSEEYGGRGGNILHRAAIYEELAAAGYPPRFVYEHLEVLLPSLARFGNPELMSDLLPRMLRGEETWCQGFSEPGAGSDLAALRTRAIVDGDDWIIDGHKIWTSWSKWARRCLLVARTGTLESRHRELSCFVVDLELPGVTVVPINQSNGSPELAEIFFDSVAIGPECLVGEVNGGWSVAMYLLSCERGSFAWQRNTLLYQRLAEFAGLPSAASDLERLGNSAADLFAMRARSWATMCALAADGSPGPQSAVNKAFLSDTEQYLFETGDRIHPTGYMWTHGSRDEALQEELLFSHAISIYGGTRQIQNITIYRQLIEAHTESPADEYLQATLAAVNDSAGVEAGLATLGFTDVVRDLEDPDNRRAVAAVFEAMGRTSTAANALPTLFESIMGEGRALVQADSQSDNGSVWVAGPVGVENARTIVWDSGDGWLEVATSAVDWSLPTPCLTPGYLIHGVVDALAAQPCEAALGMRATTFGRWALAWEVLGAADAMFDVAVDHARNREQFGASLNSFQAVQFMLSEAHIARTMLREVCAATTHALSAEAADLAKVLAGRLGRRVGRETLQVLGAIGFTEEHDHHRWFHRVLVIDALLGRSTELARTIGAQMIDTGVVPQGVALGQLPEAVLSAGGADHEGATT